MGTQVKSPLSTWINVPVIPTIGLLLFTLSFGCIPCKASIYQLKDEIDAYTKGDFQNVVFIGKAVENEAAGTDNLTARYYLANAYSRLNRFQEALEEYKICYLYSKDPKIKLFAEQAIRALPQSISSIPVAPPTSINMQHHSNISSVEQSIYQEQDNAINELTKQAQKQIADTNIARDNDTAAVPQYSYDTGRRHRNPDYSSTVNRITDEAQRKVDILNEDLSRRINQVKAAYGKKLEGLADSKTNLNSQLAPSTGDIQLVPLGSSLYIRNYVNYGGESPTLSPPPAIVGLKAKQRILMLNTPIHQHSVGP